MSDEKNYKEIAKEIVERCGEIPFERRCQLCHKQEIAHDVMENQDFTVLCSNQRRYKCCERCFMKQCEQWYCNK